MADSLVGTVDASSFVAGTVSPGAPHIQITMPTHHAPAQHQIPLRCGLRYDQLLDYIAKRPSLSILEIGVARAATTLRMLAFADSLGGKPHYVGIDLFGMITDELMAQSHCSVGKRPQTIEITTAQLQILLGPEIAGRMELREGFTHDVLAELIDERREFDLIFIDAGHSLESVEGDWRACQKLVARGGTIVFDDYPNWGIGPTVDNIDRKHWQVRVLPHRDTFQKHEIDDDPSPVRHHQLVEVRQR